MQLESAVGATAPSRLPAPGFAAGVTVPLVNPRVLARGGLPVIDVDVAADDRATRVTGIKRGGRAERFGCTWT